ncbi:MAG: TlpA family protein disulfide reductase [Ilumatobacteraceae bacterium]|jgi:cytochrome c biogenesis protein CcmG/thiol:disulfide interchange protein DsbE|nr:TlpA family protein disulfide reductase [Ilumatobacteraceae bacterium]
MRDRGIGGSTAFRGRRSSVIATAVGIVVALFFIVLVVSSPEDRESAASPLLGNPAPVVKSTTLDDMQFELSRRRGSWVMFNFFNSTCVPCRQEHPELVAFHEAQAAAGTPTELYSVINDDSDNAVRAFFEANRGDWSKIRDDDGSIAVAFGVAKVPETWIIDPNGYVRMRFIGAVTKNLLDEKLTELQAAFEGM